MGSRHSSLLRVRTWRFPLFLTISLSSLFWADEEIVSRLHFPVFSSHFQHWIISDAHWDAYCGAHCDVYWGARCCAYRGEHGGANLELLRFSWTTCSRLSDSLGRSSLIRVWTSSRLGSRNYVGFYRSTRHTHRRIHPAGTECWNNAGEGGWWVLKKTGTSGFLRLCRPTGHLSMPRLVSVLMSLFLGEKIVCRSTSSLVTCSGWETQRSLRTNLWPIAKRGWCKLMNWCKTGYRLQLTVPRRFMICRWRLCS